MKVIGSITARDKEDYEYAGGVIVKLTRNEAYLLRCLQDAWDGKIFHLGNVEGVIENKEMDDVFKAIKTFTEIKFALNEFKEAVNTLDKILVGSNEL